MERIDTVIVGAGQAGLATSYWLARLNQHHVVLDRAATAASVWRNNRWDSFSMVSPNWWLRMPGAAYSGADPDGFLSRSEIIAYFARYAEDFRLPVQTGIDVTSVEPAGDHRYLVRTRSGTIEARNVVIATGVFQSPRVPAFGANLSSTVTQLHSHDYRNPGVLPDGGVLVVGSGMSGSQIAEELYLAGRQVHLSTGATGRAPRRYRGKDTVWWMTELGFFDLTIEEMPPGTTRFDSVPHLSGAMGGHTLNLRRFARDGVTLLGRLHDTVDTSATFAPNLHDNLASADAFERMLTNMIDGYIAQQGLDVPPDTLPELRDGFDQPLIERLDLDKAGVTSVIWATGYRFDYSLVKLPVFDADGYPIQDRGVTAFPGLHFVGLPWMPSDRSGSLLGVGEFAEHIADSIAGALVPG